MPSATRLSVLELSGAGFRPGEIATLLRISGGTVKTHLKRHRRKSARLAGQDPYRMLRFRKVRVAQLSACGRSVV